MCVRGVPPRKMSTTALALLMTKARVWGTNFVAVWFLEETLSDSVQMAFSNFHFQSVSTTSLMNSVLSYATWQQHAMHVTPYNKGSSRCPKGARYPDRGILQLFVVDCIIRVHTSRELSWRIRRGSSSESRRRSLVIQEGMGEAPSCRGTGSGRCTR